MQPDRGPDGIRFAVGTFIFGELEPEHLALVAALGFPGVEPYRQLVMPYVERPHELKALLDRHGLAMARRPRHSRTRLQRGERPLLHDPAANFVEPRP